MLLESMNQSISMLNFIFRHCSPQPTRAIDLKKIIRVDKEWGKERFSFFVLMAYQPSSVI